MNISGRVIVTKSPALQPGDIQFATAMDAPEDSPLQAPHNCVVFSQKALVISQAIFQAKT